MLEEIWMGLLNESFSRGCPVMASDGEIMDDGQCGKASGSEFVNAVSAESENAIATLDARTGALESVGCLPGCSLKVGAQLGLYLNSATSSTAETGFAFGQTTEAPCLRQGMLRAVVPTAERQAGLEGPVLENPEPHVRWRTLRSGLPSPASPETPP